MAKPTDITISSDKQTMTVAFDDGLSFALAAEMLRVESPSAEVQGHGGQKEIIGGKQYVQITNLEPVGNYAIRILFDDGHDTGLFTWSYLYEMGLGQAEIWSAYTRALAENGLDRDPFPKVG
jgi:DUF971 family protein